MIGANACTSCARLDREAPPTEDQRGKCSSFEDGIPEVIWSGEHAHQVSLDDEDTWVPLPGWDEEFDSYLEVYEALTGEKPDGLPEEDPNPG